MKASGLKNTIYHGFALFFVSWKKTNGYCSIKTTYLM